MTLRNGSIIGEHEGFLADLSKRADASWSSGDADWRGRRLSPASTSAAENVRPRTALRSTPAGLFCPMSIICATI
jgi:hypothetical protein